MYSKSLTYPCEIPVLRSITQLQFSFLLMWQTSQYAIEDVVIALISTLGHNSWLLQQVLFNLSTFYYTLMIEMNVYIFTKPGWIVISDGLGISKCYEWNRIKNQIFKVGKINFKGQRNFYSSYIPLMKTCYLKNTGNYTGNIVACSSQGIVKVDQIKRCDKHAAQMWKTNDVYRILVTEPNEN